jgi:hypothetical protein
MARLVEQPIKTLFQGVSRQPDTVRLPGQVQECDNALLSVTTGGFSKRPGTIYTARLDSLAGVTEMAVYGYDRDEVEQYIVLIRDGFLDVYDLAGNRKTVANAEQVEDFAFEVTGTIDATRDIALAYVTTGDTAETSVDLVFSENGGVDIEVYTSPTGAFAGEETLVKTFTAAGSDTITIAPFIQLKVINAGTNYSLTGAYKSSQYLVAGNPRDDFSFVTIADYTIIANSNITTGMGAVGSGAVDDTVQKWADLPGTPADGDVAHVTGEALDEFSGYYVAWDTVTWNETVKPNERNTLLAASMPHKLVRNADGTFTFDQISWEAREVGDPILVPDPAFIGRKVQDVVFYRNRLVIVADEQETCSQAGDYFNYWPDKALQVLDADPLERSASSSEVNILRFAVVVRKVLFATSDKRQFETTADGIFTPKTAHMDPTTKYEASSICRPKEMGDTLYFVGDSSQDGVLFEYLIDDDTLSNIALIITKHVEGYVPGGIFKLAGDATSGTLCVLSYEEQNVIYVFTTYWDGETKLQAAWHRWTLGDTVLEAKIMGMEFLNGYLWLLIRRNDDHIYFERLSLRDEFTNDE